MITVVVQGGLGNQLFQYAYGRALMTSGKDVVFDTSFFGSNHKYTKRPFLLEHFFLIDHIRTTTTYPKQKLLTRIINKIDIDRRVRHVPVKRSADNYLADGYYTSEKYFSQIRNIILEEVRLKEESIFYKEWQSRITSARKPLIIHARRTDFVGSGFVNLDAKYYEKALSYFDDDCEIFAFSDDIKWLSSVIKRPFTAVSGNNLKDYEELMLMSLGQNFVIANSTFSWWGAWLSQKEGKKVVAPKKWFKSPFWWRAEKTVVPNSWIAI